MPTLLNIIGCKNAGKTRTIELLIPVFKKLGLKTGTLKHTEHDGFNWDVKGKDTNRHSEAGSEVTGIFGNNSFAFNFNTNNSITVEIDNLIKVFYNQLDIVLIEGLKTDHRLKIEVCRKGFTDRKLVNEKELIATYGDNIHNYQVHHFSYGEEMKLGEFIIKEYNHLKSIKPL